MGDVHGKRRIVLLGDSHILMWVPAINIIAKRRGYQLIPIAKLGCTPYLVDAWKFNRGAEYTECNQWRPWALEKVKAAKPDVVVVGSSSVVTSADPATGRRMSLAGSERAWRHGARALARRLTAITPRVRFLQDTNRTPFKPSRCLSRHTAAHCTFKPSRWVAMSNRLVDRGVRRSAATYVRISDLFCAADVCPTELHGIVIYADSNHITPRYAEYRAHNLGHRLRLRS